ncbi:MAG: septum formation initiator family protein [Opitutales bacterium]
MSALSWSSWRTAVRELEHQQTREAELSREIRQLQASIERQRAYAERLETDDALAERVLRERLGYVRPGDIVFRFPSAR